MNVAYTKQFIKDVKRYPRYKSQILKIIQTFQNSDSLSGIPNIKRLHSDGDDYRLRIGNFRIGFSIIDEQIVFRRFLTRKDIYKYFP